MEKTLNPNRKLPGVQLVTKPVANKRGRLFGLDSGGGFAFVFGENSCQLDRKNVNA
jgi:hypothetical protein